MGFFSGISDAIGGAVKSVSGAISPGFGSLLGGGVSAIGSIFGQSSANDANAAMSRDQMIFQERMSSTAHQREVADLKAAGLNPILSSGGTGASSPAGAQAVMGNVFGQAADSFGKVLSSAVQAERLKTDLDAVRSTTDKNVADAALSNELIKTQDWERELKSASAAAALASARTDLERQALLRSQVSQTTAETARILEEARRVRVDTDIRQEVYKGARTEGEIDETPYGRVFRYLDRALGTVGAVARTASSAKSR